MSEQKTSSKGIEMRDVIVEREGDWVTLLLNRPEAKNALSLNLTAEMLDAIESIRVDKTLRGVIIRGAGAVFCAGGDLKEFLKIASGSVNSREDSTDFSKQAAQIFTALKTLPQITVAVVEGAAMAGGFGMCCACDLIISYHDTKFGLSEPRIGLVAAQIAPFVIGKLGYAKARQLMLLARPIDGKQAFDWGMVDFLASDEAEIQKEIANIKELINACSPYSIAATKEVLLEAQYTRGDKFIDYAADLFTDCLVSEDGVEGFKAFTDKRKPRWNV